MASPKDAPYHHAVTVGLEDLQNSEPALPCRLLRCEPPSDQDASDNVSFSLLEQAFGSSSLGIIIVEHLPPRFHALRHRLLSYSSALGHLPKQELGMCTVLHALSGCPTVPALIRPQRSSSLQHPNGSWGGLAAGRR